LTHVYITVQCRPTSSRLNVTRHSNVKSAPHLNVKAVCSRSMRNRHVSLTLHQSDPLSHTQNVSFWDIWHICLF